MSKILFLKGVCLQDSQINANWQGDTKIELSDIYMESLGRQQIRRMEQKQKHMQEESDLGTEPDVFYQISQKDGFQQQTTISEQLGQISITGENQYSYKGPKIKGMKLESIYELESISAKIQGILSCFHCTLNIQTPIYAVSFDNQQLTIKYIFCSFVCGFSFANQISNSQKVNKLKEMLKNYYKFKYGKIINYKQIKIKREDYCKFGGTLQHEQFLQYVQEQEKKLCDF